MEWTLEVNDMFKEDITKITNSLIPPDFVGDGRSIRTMQESLKRVIDQIGMLSAQAQGLSKVITTADKMRAADSHTLYLYKDAAANKGAGLVLGMLKVGRKHLFLFDESERVREVEPLCVLDFYVRDDYQRHGIGKALFDHMLQDQGTTAHRLAVDGPSEQMAEFLRKNYGVTCLLRQTNNFAVSPIFFEEMLPADEHGTNVLAQGSRAAAGCFTAHSPIANVIHGGGTPSGTQNNFWTGDDKGRRHMTSCSYSPSASYALRPAVHKTGFW